MEQPSDAPSTQEANSSNLNRKYCTECGKLILRRAEICPGCGCRQVFPAVGRAGFGQGFLGPAEASSPELETSFVTKMAILLALNFLWNGLGNLAIGDKRGWAIGFLNWIFVAIGFFTLWIPPLLFYAYCGYAGYKFLGTPILKQGY